MKHALLLLWHKGLPQLKKLLELFSDEDFACFIHIDRKTAVTPEDWRELENSGKDVHVYSRYKIRWGGISIVKAELFLLEQIVTSGTHFDYVHFLSGQDYPIKPISEIKKFFEEHRGKEYIEHMRLPSEKWEQGTFRRFRYFYLNDVWDFHTPRGKRWLARCLQWQCKLGVKRRVPDQFERLYGGSNWMSLTGECAEYLIRKRKEYRAFYRRLKYTFAPDEVFFHTIILNSPFAAKVVNDNQRCIVWSKNASPRTLTEKDWWTVATSDCLLARKLEFPASSGLMKLTDRYILKKEDIPIDPHGCWQSATLAGHYYDTGLAEGLLRLLKLMQVKTIGDFGCGPGWYTALFRRNGYDAQGYDGNPHVEEMSAPLFGNGFYCQRADLTDELETDEPFDLVFSLEVGEHIPQQWEDTYLDNLARNAGKYIILSWAVENQAGDGHVNCRPNSYVISKMHRRGFIANTPAGNYLRGCAKRWWLKHTIMVFEKPEP